MKYLKLTIWMALAGLFLAQTAPANEPEDKLEAAQTVFQEIMEDPDAGIPQYLLDRAHCVAIVPSLKKGGFIIGGKFGQGAMLCRGEDRTGWVGPSMIKVEGGSVGLQIGGGEVDVILLAMTEEGKQKLLSTEFTLGAEAGVMAGPVGRRAKAETDAAMHAEILSYSQSKGVFAGLAFEGGTLRADPEENEKLYGREVSHKKVLNGQLPTPTAASGLIRMLTKYSKSEL